jgi:hypothetical protein
VNNLYVYGAKPISGSRRYLLRRKLGFEPGTAAASAMRTSPGARPPHCPSCDSARDSDVAVAKKQVIQHSLAMPTRGAA